MSQKAMCSSERLAADVEECGDRIGAPHRRSSFREEAANGVEFELCIAGK
jgi:hypothetical protein